MSKLLADRELLAEDEGFILSSHSAKLGTCLALKTIDAPYLHFKSTIDLVLRSLFSSNQTLFGLAILFQEGHPELQYLHIGLAPSLVP